MALNNLKLDQLIGNETIPVFGARGQFLVTLETLSQIFASSGVKGDKGDKGDTGERGLQGDKGDTGEKGADGAKGLDGAKGDRGEKGETGEKGLDGIGLPTSAVAGNLAVYNGTAWVAMTYDDFISTYPPSA